MYDLDVAGVGRLHFGALSPARRAPEVRLDVFLLHPIHSDLACEELGIGSGPSGLSNGCVLIQNSNSRSTKKGQIGPRRPRLAQIGPRRARLAQIGSKRPRLGQIGPRGSDWLRLLQKA